MKINLNNPLVIGTMSKNVNAAGKHTFMRYGETNSAKLFIDFVQYLIDGIPDTSDFVIIDVNSQYVFKLDGLAFDVLKLKSKRYPR